MDSEGHRIRVMTVHGAKGLEAPIVILPDTCDIRPQERDEVVTVNATPVWRTPADQSPPAIATARAARKEREAEERLRLLYVALTRARSWLIVCGAGDAKQDQAWYRLVADGMQAAGAEAMPDGRLRHAFGIWPDPQPRPPQTQILPSLPDWATRPALTPARPVQPLSPSDLGGAKALPGDGLDEETAKARGTALASSACNTCPAPTRHRPRLHRHHPDRRSRPAQRPSGTGPDRSRRPLRPVQPCPQ